MNSILRSRSILAFVAVLGIGMLAMTNPSQAADPADEIAKLYALPPSGSAYVRVVDPMSSGAHIQIGHEQATQLRPADTSIATDYVIVPGSQPVQLSVNGERVSTHITVPPGDFATAILHKTNAAYTAKITTDTPSNIDGLKAELVFYNLTPECEGSITLSSGPTVFESLASGTRTTRAINPVAARLIGHCGTQQSAEFTLPPLKVGDRFSLFLIGDATTPRLVGQINHTRPYRP